MHDIKTPELPHFTDQPLARVIGQLSLSTALIMLRKGQLPVDTAKTIFPARYWNVIDAAVEK